MKLFIASIILMSSVASFAGETHCGIYSNGAHTNYLDDGKAGVDLLRSQLAEGVTFPEIGSCVCIDGVIGPMLDRTQFLSISAVQIAAATVCGK